MKAECKHCGSCNISICHDSDEILYKGKVINVPGVYSVCRQCNQEFVSKEQIIQNDVFFVDAAFPKG